MRGEGRQAEYLEGGGVQDEGGVDIYDGIVGGHLCADPDLGVEEGAVLAGHGHEAGAEVEEVEEGRSRRWGRRRGRRWSRRRRGRRRARGGGGGGGAGAGGGAGVGAGRGGQNVEQVEQEECQPVDVAVEGGHRLGTEHEAGGVKGRRRSGRSGKRSGRRREEGRQEKEEQEEGQEEEKQEEERSKRAGGRGARGGAERRRWWWGSKRRRG